MRRRYKSGLKWSLWRWTDVVIGGELYLRRLHLVQTPWFAVMIHWFKHFEDPNQDLHDHPVSFLSIVLRGWYVEQTPAGPRLVLWWNRKRATDQHRVLGARYGTTTLVFAGPKVREWGFHTPTGWVPWREYQK